MRTLEATGKTIDEAIFNGLKELGVSIDEVEIDIIQHETKGILGIGAKPAKVKLIEREPEEVVVPEYMIEAERRANSRKNGDYRRDDRRRDDRYNNRRNDRRSDRPLREYNDEKPAKQETAANTEAADTENLNATVIESETIVAETVETEAVENTERTERREYRPRRNDRRNNRRDYRREREEEEPREKKPEIEYSLEAAENNEAAQFLKQLLEKMNVPGEVLANVSEEDGVRLKIESSGMGVLIGHRGETLDAIQYLTSLHVNRSRKEKGFTRVTVDTEGYRERREETLARLARKVASQVRSTGRARSLEPMNPYERRVLHSTLQNNPYVTTYSEGEEPNRRVVIAPKEE
jgi:spoIIIJ-associated protein